MPVDGSVDRRRDAPANMGNGNGVVLPIHSARRLRLNPNTEHKPDSYDDIQLEFSPLLFSSLERYLPPTMLNVSRDAKVQYMREILMKYSPEGERNRVHRHREYKQKIISNYQLLCLSLVAFFELLASIMSRHYRNVLFCISLMFIWPLHRELYSMHATNFFVPSFLRAINDNSESFRSIVSEPAPGIFIFEMLQPRFCELLLSEVENFEKWVCQTKFRIMQPNTMNKYGAVLDDFGLETMLDKLMNDYICPLSKVFFSEVGGSTLDSHHGFVVEYGINRDIDLGFHVDDAEVALNVCLGKQFSGGELFFRGVRCDRHVNSETQPEEILDYCHVPGCAVLHRGRHRHGARATTGGNRINLILWCRSSVFRELKKYQKDFSSWCGECQRKKKERLELSVSATKLELLKRDEEPTS